MPANGHSAQRYQHIKVGNLKSSKSDHISTRGGPFDRPLTPSGQVLGEPARSIRCGFVHLCLPFLY